MPGTGSRVRGSYTQTRTILRRIHGRWHWRLLDDFGSLIAYGSSKMRREARAAAKKERDSYRQRVIDLSGQKRNKMPTYFRTSVIPVALQRANRML